MALTMATPSWAAAIHLRCLRHFAILRIVAISLSVLPTGLR
ncbi:MAG: hypothetical protein ACREKB_05330 [Candidatus Rokuibacteriota bacterium]